MPMLPANALHAKRLLAWAKTKRAEEIVGHPAQSAACPLARYLDEVYPRGHAYWRVGYGYISLRNADTTSDVTGTDDRVRAMLHAVDRYERGITAAEFIALLESLA